MPLRIFYLGKKLTQENTFDMVCYTQNSEREADLKTHFYEVKVGFYKTHQFLKLQRLPLGTAKVIHVLLLYSVLFTRPGIDLSSPFGNNSIQDDVFCFLVFFPSPPPLPNP